MGPKLTIWLCSISSWLGMPPPLGAASHLETISTLCRDPAIPIWYRARAEIHRQTVQVVNAVGSGASFQMRHSLIKVYESELDRVKTNYEYIWNDDLEIEWAGARLYLYGIAFVQPSSTLMTNNPETTLAAREVLLRGLEAAIGCLVCVMQMQLPPTQPGENRSDVPDRVYQLGFYPKHFFRIGAFANYFLLWFLNVDSEAPPRDKEVARTFITLTYQLLTSFTHSHEHYRAGKAIELLANMPINMTGPAVNSRLGAGIMFSVAMNAQAGEHGLTTKGMGIDAVGPEGAHPKVVHHDPTSSRGATGQPTTNPSPASTYSSADVSSPIAPPPAAASSSSLQYDTRQVSYAQYGAGSTPTSTHSAPEPSRPMLHQQQSQQQQQHYHEQAGPSTTQQQQHPALIMSAATTMSPDQEMFMRSQMDPMPHDPASQVSLAEQQAFMQNAMFDPSMLADMTSANWEYPWGEWNGSVLQHGVPQDPVGASQYMGNMDLNARSYSGR